MRRAITILLAAGALVGLGAQPAVADGPNVTYSNYTATTIGGYSDTRCQTEYQHGSYGQYGAWGWYIDGCTTRPIRCNSTYSCRYTVTAWMQKYLSSAARVTQNVRIRFYRPDGAYDSHWDISCDTATQRYNHPSISSCAAGYDDHRDLPYGWKITVQCNGVRGGEGPDTDWQQWAYNKCAADMVNASF